VESALKRQFLGLSQDGGGGSFSPRPLSSPHSHGQGRITASRGRSSSPAGSSRPSSPTSDAQLAAMKELMAQRDEIRREADLEIHAVRAEAAQIVKRYAGFVPPGLVTAPANPAPIAGHGDDDDDDALVRDSFAFDGSSAPPSAASVVRRAGGMCQCPTLPPPFGHRWSTARPLLLASISSSMGLGPGGRTGPPATGAAPRSRPGTR
jgi:hypothetical protein